MKRLSKISLLLGGLLLTACSSPKISDVKVQIVDNAPQNYKQVTKTEISSKVETEAELKNNAQENKDKDTYDWTGTSSKTIESIKIKYKQDYSDREYKYTYDIASGKYKYKWVTVKRTRVDEYVYKYHDNKLEFVTQNQRTE